MEGTFFFLSYSVVIVGFFWYYDNEKCNHLLLKMTGENSPGSGDNVESRLGSQVRSYQMQRRRNKQSEEEGSPGLGEGT